MHDKQPESVSRNSVKAPRGTARSKRKRKRRPAAQEFFPYLMRVSSWDFYYWLRATDPKNRWEDGRYSEITTLTIRGDLIRPENSKFRRVELTLSARAGMLQEPAGDTQTTIGSVTANDDILTAYVFVPQERIGALATMAQSGCIEVISFTTDKLRYRSCRIYSLSLNTEFNEDD